jgi:phage terminase small subunit
MTNTTQQQKDFAVQMVLTGGNGAEAARRAGFAADSAAQAAYRLMRLPHVQATVRMEQERVLKGHMASKALYVLEQIMDDENAPAGARVDAAKTVLDRAGLPAVRQPEPIVLEKPLGQMSVQELEAFIAAGREKLRDMQAIPAFVVEADNE